MTTPDFDGETYERERDHERLARQMAEVQAFMHDGEWHTSEQIVEALGENWASLSARLRDLRKVKFGAWIVERRYVADGLWEYRMTARPEQEPPNLTPIPVPDAPKSPIPAPETLPLRGNEASPPGKYRCPKPGCVQTLERVANHPFVTTLVEGRCYSHGLQAVAKK